jgi:DNA polymerase III subunit epsilon
MNAQAQHPAFVAIDFETADRPADSACAVALVRVEGLRIVARKTCLLRPPRRNFLFTYIHGITWDHVANAPTFATAWAALSELLEGAAFLAAHNASFDRRVLQTCCVAARLAVPSQPFECTLRLARRVWGLKPAKLPDVCAHLGFSLRHHDPASDAEACARIVIAALGRSGQHA